MKYPVVIRVLAISAVIASIGNFFMTKRAVTPMQAIPGLLILVAFSILGFALSKVVPVKIPSIAYISALAIIWSIPGVPGAEAVIKYVGKVQFLALCTPILAYAGISIGKDLEAFKSQGVKIVITALLTFVGTFVGSAVIAEIILRMTGTI